jgi:hypothetical protein
VATSTTARPHPLSPVGSGPSTLFPATSLSSTSRPSGAWRASSLDAGAVVGLLPRHRCGGLVVGVVVVAWWWARGTRSQFFVFRKMFVVRACMAKRDLLPRSGGVPGKLVLCGLCCVFSRKPHGKDFVVRFLSSAVRRRRTANAVFLVVIVAYMQYFLLCFVTFKHVYSFKTNDL